jgi:protein-disulfide isomerase
MTESPDTETITFKLKKTYVFLALGLLAGSVGGFMAGFSMAGSRPEAPLRAVVSPTPTLEVRDVATEGRPQLGADDAPITIVEFTDYECPFCGRYIRETYPALLAEYGDRMKYVVRNFPLSSIHPNARKAAEAAECAFDQGQFWEYHDVLFQNQEALDVPSLKTYADELGLDVESFSTCLDSGAKREVVAADHRDALAHGVNGTPTFFVNGRMLVGAQQLAAFEALFTD